MVVGYTGGLKAYPTYKNIKDHTEAVRVVYDPFIISFEEILIHFANQGGLSPYQSYKIQYRCAIMYHTQEQRILAVDFINRIERKKNRQIFVDVEPAGDFYRAEEYHQKYVLKQGGGNSGCSW